MAVVRRIRVVVVIVVVHGAGRVGHGAVKVVMGVIVRVVVLLLAARGLLVCGIHVWPCRQMMVHHAGGLSSRLVGAGRGAS